MEPALWVLQVCSGVLAGACQEQYCAIYLKGFSGYVSMTVSMQHLAEDSRLFPPEPRKKRTIGTAPEGWWGRLEELTLFAGVLR
ncbi:hypothetical protein MHYP_G00171350 [Metynnis hypsauchen]